MSELKIVETDIENRETSVFLSKWEDDIESFFIHFTEEDADFSNLFMLKFKEQEAGIFIYQQKGEELHVHVDYVIPEFRNLGIGQKFFQQKLEEFKSKGFATVVALTNNESHRQYLISLGFNISNKHPHRYELNLF